MSNDPQTTSSAKRERIVRGICIGIVVVSGLEFLIATTYMTMRRLPDSTDFATYYLAGAQAREGLTPYDAVALAARGHALGFEHDQFPFLYPPPFALVMQPLARWSYERARGVWVLVVTAALWGGLILNARIMRIQAVRLQLQNRMYFWIVLAAFVPAALNSTGVHNDIRAGSVAALLYLSLMLVTWAMLARRPAWSGVGLAAAVVLKLTPAAALAWAAWRRAWRAVWLSLALLAVASLLSAWRWGTGIGVDYLRTALWPAITHEAALPMNQSLDAMLSRLLVPSQIVQSPFDMPALKNVLSIGLSLLLAAFTWATLRRRQRHAALLPVELGLVMLAVLMLMKLTWLHTLAAILFVWPCLMLPIVRAAERGAPWALRVGIVASLGFFLSSAHIPVLWSGLRQGPAVMVISVHLVGLLTLWWASRFVLEREADVVS